MTATTRRAAAMVLTCLALAGCPSLPQRGAEPQSWDVRRAELQARDSFALAGRVAVAAGEEGFNARLRWQQSGESSEVALDGPLGAGGVRIVSDGASLRVETSRGEQLDAEAARAEIARRLGFEPPLQSLRYWVLGVPDPSIPATETLDAEARLATLEQAGWRIEYTEYSAVAGRWLPRRLTLHHGEVRVRLFFDNWRA
jgi:outer membrane lipoprotein LolB